MVVRVMLLLNYYEQRNEIGPSHSPGRRGLRADYNIALHRIAIGIYRLPLLTPHWSAGVTNCIFFPFATQHDFYQKNNLTMLRDDTGHCMF
jgi:hypothetical protein